MKEFIPFKLDIPNIRIMNKYTVYQNEFQNKPEIFFQDNKLYIHKSLMAPRFIENFQQNNSKFNNKPEDNKYDSSYNPFPNQFYSPSGLINIGGICYLNAVLQCFYYCSPLTQYFLNLDNYSIRNLGLISKSYYSLIKGMSSGNIYAAKDFKDALITTDSSFKGTEGKDSKDVAQFILSELQSELRNEENSVFKINDQLNPYNEIEVFKECIDVDKANNSIISETFNYMIETEEKCKNKYCGKFNKSFYSIESDNLLFFYLRNIWEESGKSRYRKLSLTECFDNFIQTKNVKCSYCNKKSLEMKQTFVSLPKIIIIVVSRGRNNEFSCDVNFDMTLDMSKYYKSILSNDIKKDINTKYNLIGATFLYEWAKPGTGHTVAFCKTYNGKYYVFNDSTPRETSPYEINDKKPYLLFYERNY